MKTFRRSALVLLAATASLTLAGCGGSETPPPAETNLEDTGPVVNEPEIVNEAPLPTPTPEATNLTAEDPAEAKAVEQQMQEDADATGMTARIDRSAEDPAEEKAQPADVTEKK